MQQKYTCPLCHSNAEFFYNEQFRKCNKCQSIFRCPDFFITPDKEKSRYQEHDNNIQDRGYQDFVSPIVNQVLKNHTSEDIGLDFGAGTGPVISHLLGQEGFHPSLYDPFFHNKPGLLLRKYDYIIACEVVEHFHNPQKEFQLLYNLLKPGGTLYIMTHLYSKNIDFKNWYYKNDATHVFFYSKKSIQGIYKTLGFSSYTIDNRLICLKK